MARSRGRNIYHKRLRPRRLFEECQFCRNEKNPDYKNIEELEKYLRKTAKITPRKNNGNCAKHQRRLATAIKRARLLALLPFV